MRTYDAIEQAVMSWPGTEVVTRDRYALFRTTKIFADLTVMREAIRLVMHLRRRVDDARFIKTVEGRGQISHVVKLRSPEELDDFVPLLREAYELVEGD